MLSIGAWHLLLLLIVLLLLLLLSHIVSLELLAFILVPEEAEATGSYAQDDEDNW